MIVITKLKIVFAEVKFKNKQSFLEIMFQYVGYTILWITMIIINNKFFIA